MAQQEIELTPEQETELLEYKKQYEKKLLSTQPLDMGEAIEGARLSYKLAGHGPMEINGKMMQPPFYCFAFDSPLAGTIATMVLTEVIDQFEKDGNLKPIENHWKDWYIEKPLIDDVNELDYKEIIRIVGREAIRQFNCQNQVWAKESVLDKFLEMDKKQLHSKYQSASWGQVGGSHDASWLAFYAYFKERMNQECCNQLNGLFKMADSCGWWTPCLGFAVFQHRHVELHMTNEEQIHNSNGPAVRWRDGYSLYVMNGVQVPAVIANTPANQLDPHLVLTTDNVEVRREIVRKIGIERVLEGLNAKVIDKASYDIDVPIGHETDEIQLRKERIDYELVGLDLGDERIRPYLKMRNPSIGVYHVEGVPTDTKSVMEAIKFRNGGLDIPQVLS